jgi:hypothetical protein
LFVNQCARIVPLDLNKSRCSKYLCPFISNPHKTTLGDHYPVDQSVTFGGSAGFHRRTKDRCGTPPKTKLLMPTEKESATNYRHQKGQLKIYGYFEKRFGATKLKSQTLNCETIWRHKT